MLPSSSSVAELAISLIERSLPKICKKAAKNKGEQYILIIDVINRGDVAKIFGELLYCLEYRGTKIGEVILPYSNGRFVILENVLIIGTMNSTDRSIGLLDFAKKTVFFYRTAAGQRSPSKIPKRQS